MSKLVAFLVAAAGASTVSVGGTFLLKSQVTSKGSGNSDSNDGGDSSGTTTNTFIEDVSTFKTKSGDACSKKLFGQLTFDNISTDAKGLTDNSSDLSSYFGNAPSGADAETKGCLFIDWKKTTTDSDSKWRGTFTWSWSFINKDKGLITFSVAKANTTNKKLGLTGLTYLLTKDTSTQAWKITHKQEVTTAKDMEKNDFDNKFPKAKSGLSVVKGSQDYWGFIDNKEKLDSMCDNDDCSGSETNPSEPKKFFWKWESGGSEKIAEWCENFSWWDHIYSDSTSLKLNEKLGSFSGKWSTSEA